MSQAGILDIESANPQIPTQFDTDDNNPAVPIANILEILGETVANGLFAKPVFTTGSGNTVTVNVQVADESATSDINIAGLASFDSAAFTVDDDGFVRLVGGGSTAVTSFIVQENDSPIFPNASGQIIFTGDTVAPWQKPVTTYGINPSQIEVVVQRASAFNVSDVSRAGIALFDNAYFLVDTNGFVTLTSGNTDYHDSRYIVSAGGITDGANYTTIASAYAAAVAVGAPQTVMVQPGIYTENITLTPGINICSHSCDSANNVTIVGKLSASSAGVTAISGIKLQTNGDYCLSVTGSAATYIDLIDCNIIAQNNNAIQLTSSGGPQVVLQSCQGDLAATYAYFTQSGNGLLQFVDCFMINNGASTVASTLAGSGSAEFHNTFFYNSVTNSGTSNFIADNSHVGGALIIGSTGTSNVASNISILSGSDSSVSVSAGATFTLANSVVNSSNTNAVTGAGTIVYGGLTFNGISSLINTTTQTPIISSNDAIKVKSPGAYPYTTVPQDALILVDTSSARTITPLASPTTGQKHIIKDSVGSAAANNITVTPSGKNIDGAASSTMNINYGSMTIIYNGTEWSII